MQRQMDLGRRATILSRESTERGEVDIFAPVEPCEVVSVEDQKIAVLKFFKLKISDT